MIVAAVFQVPAAILRDRNAAALDVSLFALPPILAYVFWLTYNKLILGSWRAFLHVADATQGADGETTSAAVTPPTPPWVVQCGGNGAHDGSVQAAKCSLPGTADFLLHNLLGPARPGPVLLLLVPLLLLSSGWNPRQPRAAPQSGRISVHRASSRLRDAREHLEQGGLPGAVAADDPHDVATRYVEADVTQRRERLHRPVLGSPEAAAHRRVSASAADTDRGAWRIV